MQRIFAILFAFALGLLPTIARADMVLGTVADKAVTTAGTRVQLSSTNVWVYSVVVEAELANTGKIYIGDVNVASGRGHQLEPGQSISFSSETVGARVQFVNLKNIYIDSSVNGESVKITYQVANNVNPSHP